MSNSKYAQRSGPSSSAGRRRIQEPQRKLSYLQHLGVESLAKGHKQTASALPIAQAPAPAQAQTTAGSKTNKSTNQETNIPTEQGIPTTPMEIESTTEEEEDLLLAEPVTMVPQDKPLLTLRQDYKKICTNITRATSHLNFIQLCEEGGSVPKGLRVNVNCNALLAEYTQVKENFASTKETAEKDFLCHLKAHYNKVLEKLEVNLKDLQEKMEEKVRLVNDEEKKIHAELLEKTKENIAKHKERLLEQKRKKLEHITSRRDTRQPQRSRRRNEPYAYRPKQDGQARRRPSGPARQGNIVPSNNGNATRAHQEPAIEQQVPQPNLSREMAEMRTMLNQLLLKQTQPQFRPPPTQPQIPPNYLPPAQQHPSLLPMPVGMAATGQHPSLDSRQPQYFQR